MMFLIENAPLQEWEADVLGCLREEAYYFLPQRMTKIINEGWGQLLALHNYDPKSTWPQ